MAGRPFWDLVRHQVDEDPEPGQYLLTGRVTDTLALGVGREERALATPESGESPREG